MLEFKVSARYPFRLPETIQQALMHEIESHFRGYGFVDVKIDAIIEAKGDDGRLCTQTKKV